MKIYIELPDNIFDIDAADLASQLNLHSLVKDQIKAAVCNYYLTNIELPKIEVTPEEVKDRIITLLAEKSISNLTNQ